VTEEPKERVVPTALAPGRSGRAIVSPIAENTAVLPSDGPCFDDCYTPLLHKPDHDLGSSSGKRSGKRAGGCYPRQSAEIPRVLCPRGQPSGVACRMANSEATAAD